MKRQLEFWRGSIHNLTNLLWLTIHCLFAQRWAAHRTQWSRVPHLCLSRREPSPLSAALTLTVLLSTSYGTDSTLGKALSFCCPYILIKTKRKENLQLRPLKPTSMSHCLSETLSPATQPPTSVQRAHSASQTPAAYTQTCWAQQCLVESLGCRAQASCYLSRCKWGLRITV